MRAVVLRQVVLGVATMSCCTQNIARRCHHFTAFAVLLRRRVAE
ncbi:hypothetical protein BZL29_5756 [Mycobacterium kansasii]|uniref:Uncharacterized protein n=1 Tax=Mycobacterium kansasii TaxID=1768 RepID=A0A1V3WY26_MYCKA|nr:hypothetical protein BZL29_5756 [Mycobacterium kansasii]